MQVRRQKGGPMSMRGLRRAVLPAALALLAIGLHTMPASARAGVITEFPLPPDVGADLITTGPDGNLWFTDSFHHKVGRMTPDGTVTTFPLDISSRVSDISPGPDGNLWFTDYGRNKIGRV